MAELRMKIKSSILDELKRKLNLERNTDVVSTALSILNWAVNEKSNGRQILSSKPDNKEIHRLIMKELETID